MKNIPVFVFLLALFASSTSFSQAPVSNKYESRSQMWNISNVYRNTPFYISSKNTNLGTQIDTVTSTATLYTAWLYAGAVNADTFMKAPVPDGSGTISFITTAWKGQRVTTTVNPIVVITPKASFDGVNYANIPGATAATLTPTSGNQSSALTAKWDFTAKQGNYFAASVSVTADTAAVQMFYDFQRTTTFGQ